MEYYLNIFVNPGMNVDGEAPETSLSVEDMIAARLESLQRISDLTNDGTGSGESSDSVTANQIDSGNYFQELRETTNSKKIPYRISNDSPFLLIDRDI